MSADQQSEVRPRDRLIYRDYSRRSVVRTARKRCAKCGRAGWYRPRERRCKLASPKALSRIGA